MDENELKKIKNELKEMIELLERVLPELSLRISNEGKSPDERHDILFNSELLNECRRVINTFNDKEKGKYSSPEVKEALEKANERGEWLKKARQVPPDKMQKPFTI